MHVGKRSATSYSIMHATVGGLTMQTTGWKVMHATAGRQVMQA